jgi:SPP1 family predicted phage head-tail adaptor
MDCSLLRLDRKISIQELIKSPDGQGGKEQSWQEIFSTFANLKPMSANQVLFSANLQHRVTHKVYIRYRSGLNISQRIIYGDRIFQIRGIINIDERNRWLEISTEEGAAS